MWTRLASHTSSQRSRMLRGRKRILCALNRGTNALGQFRCSGYREPDLWLIYTNSCSKCLVSRTAPVYVRLFRGPHIELPPPPRPAAQTQMSYAWFFVTIHAPRVLKCQYNFATNHDLARLIFWASSNDDDVARDDEYNKYIHTLLSVCVLLVGLLANLSHWPITVTSA